MELRKIQLAIIYVLASIGLLVGMGGPYIASREFLKTTYRIRVDSIQFRPGNRGMPYIYADGNWRILSMQEIELLHYLEPGDSVIKPMGDKITVVRFRDGTRISREFKSN